MFDWAVILSIFPFVLFLILLLWKKLSLLWTSLVTLAVIFGLQIFYWQIIPIYLADSLTKGILVAFDIFIIILGAIFFLEV